MWKEESNTHEGETDVSSLQHRRRWLPPTLLLVTLMVIGGLLTAWKVDSTADEERIAASQPEPMESVMTAVAVERLHRETVTSVGTVLATQSVTLRNELPGTVQTVRLTPGQIVEAGTLLVQLDVAVEEAELEAATAEARLAQSTLERSQQASQNRAVSLIEVDRAQAQRDVALAQITRIKAIIDRKTIRAPFRSRVGMSDVHRGQYLDEGTVLTTLQGIDAAANVDFAVAQAVAAGLSEGDSVRVFLSGNPIPISGAIVAIDARVDPTTRNTLVRARIVDGMYGPAPGGSVRVEVPAGPQHSAVVIPVSALRKGPAGDHVFVIVTDASGKLRAQVRPVQSGAMLATEVLILAGLEPGERVAASGSFKLRDAVLVALADAVPQNDAADAAPAQPAGEAH